MKQRDIDLLHCVVGYNYLINFPSSYLTRETVKAGADVSQSEIVSFPILAQTRQR